MKIDALMPWAGAKRTQADRIVQQLGPHSAYWEPFCGSAAVLLAKPPATMETVNDLHGDLINFARWVQSDQWVELYDRLRRTLFVAELWAASAEYCLKEAFAPTLDRAYHYFVYCWAGRNGSAGTKSGQGFCVRYTSNGGSPGTRMVGAVDSMPEWHERLRPVIILNLDGFGMVARIEDKAGSVVYVDPPYLKKSFKYTHDFAAGDHARLASLLSQFTKTRIVVSYYDHPDLVALYRGWTKIPLDVVKGLVNAGRRDEGGSVAAPEVLLVNGPAIDDAGGMFGS